MAILPMLAVEDAEAAIRFYRDAFGATERGREVEPDGRISHCELEISGSTLMVADEFSEHNVSARTLGGSSVILYLPLNDVALHLEKAIELGAELLRPLGTGPNGGSLAKIRDPFGHVWFLATGPT